MKNDEIAVIRHSRRACRIGRSSARWVQSTVTGGIWRKTAEKLLGVVLAAVSAALCVVIDALIDKEG